MSRNAILSNYFHALCKDSEQSILWNDSTLNIEWETKKPIISKKDNESELFENFRSLF